MHEILDEDLIIGKTYCRKNIAGHLFFVGKLVNIENNILFFKKHPKYDTGFSIDSNEYIPFMLSPPGQGHKFIEFSTFKYGRR